MLIRLPFVAGCAVLLINTLLGGGVAMGDLSWPPAPGSDLQVPVQLEFVCAMVKPAMLRVMSPPLLP